MYDATFIYTVLYFAVGVVMARNAKFLGAGLVTAIGLSVVYPSIEAGLFLTSISLTVTNLLAVTRE